MTTVWTNCEHFLRIEFLNTPPIKLLHNLIILRPFTRFLVVLFTFNQTETISFDIFFTSLTLLQLAFACIVYHWMSLCFCAICRTTYVMHWLSFSEKNHWVTHTNVISAARRIQLCSVSTMCYVAIEVYLSENALAQWKFLHPTYLMVLENG